jgi:hypothetical protein
VIIIQARFISSITPNSREEKVAPQFSGATFSSLEFSGQKY